MQSCGVVLLVHLIVLRGRTVALTEDQTTAAQRFAQDMMRCHGNPGLILAIVHGNSTAWASGSRTLSPPEPMTPNSLINIGALSMAFTGRV